MTGHIFKAGTEPGMGENFLFLDPAGRNFFMLWIRKAAGKAWVYREWPSAYHIPGIGVPDPWAKPSSRNPDKGNDGDRDGGQTSWGFSLLRYKFEIARLEQWQDFALWGKEGVGPDEVADYAELEEWHEENGAEEVISCRYVDARPATAPKTLNDRVTTLHTDLNELGMWWATSPANLINDDVIKIQSALEMGTLMIAEGCINLRWALSNWTGADGDKGACKDPIDCLRWFYGAGLGDELGETEGGADGGERKLETGNSKLEGRRRRMGVREGTMRQYEPRVQAAGAPRVRWRGR
jgi:hypothetical protein